MVIKMNDEHVRLVAKIQHFYDVILRRLGELEDSSLNVVTSKDSVAYKEKSCELNFLAFEFAKIFETFLYKEPDSD